MSQATKRKHVVKEVLGDFVTPTENQQIVKVNNVHLPHQSCISRALVRLCLHPLPVHV